LPFGKGKETRHFVSHGDKMFSYEDGKNKDKLGMPGMFLVDPVGKSGGLAMMWRDVDDVTIENYSRRHINVMIYSQTAKQTWKLTGFYGHPNPARRHEAWSLLKYLRNHPPAPWLCMGDYNEIINNSEKWGAATRRESQMEEFRDMVEYCQLSDLGFIGLKFTWTNGRGSAKFTKERLDRVMGNLEWCNLFRNCEVHIMETRSSNHKPMVVKLDEENRKNCARGAFRFEANWVLEEDYHEVVREAWGAGRSRQYGARGWKAECQSSMQSCSSVRWSLNDGVEKKNGDADQAVRQLSAN
jgi:hypothetical protein